VRGYAGTALAWAILIAALTASIAGGLWHSLTRAQMGEPLGELPAFGLVDQDGAFLTHRDLGGRVWIFDFIFTRCQATCPLLTERLDRVSRRLASSRGVWKASITVDPGFDTPEVLRQYASSRGIANPTWRFLTGPADEITALLRDGFGVAVGPAPGPAPENQREPILHSTRFVLVDRLGRIRGTYNALDDEALERLVRDAAALAGTYGVTLRSAGLAAGAPR
jgi:protein SCO1/2